MDTKTKSVYFEDDTLELLDDFMEKSRKNNFSETVNFIVKNFLTNLPRLMNDYNSLQKQIDNLSSRMEVIERRVME